MTMVQQRPGAANAASPRRTMIDSQLRPSGVNRDVVLAAFIRLDREDFVPEAARGVAYMDRAVPLGDGRWLAAPLVHGRMLEEAYPALSDRALVVDGGSGYLPELLRPLVGSMDIISPADAAAQGGDHGDHTLLLIDGAVEMIPDTLVARLDDDARVVTGLIRRGVTRLAIGRKVAGEVALQPLAEIGIPILPEFAAPKGWSF